MKRNLLSVLSLIALSLALTPKANAQTACASIVSSTATPATATPQSRVVLSASISNCSSSHQQLQVVTTITNSSSTTVYSKTSMVELQPNSTRTVNVNFIVPKSLPAGTYTVNTTAFSGTTQVATSSTSLTIT